MEHLLVWNSGACPQECLESLLHLDAQYRSWPRQTH